MISKSLMAGSRLYESATGRTRDEGDMLVYHSGLQRKIWMKIQTRDAGSKNFSVWGTPHNDDGENLPNKPIKLTGKGGAYRT